MFEERGVDAEYLNFPLESISEVAGLIKSQPRLRGFNVTIPYKQAIIPYLDSLSDEACEIGAVNCVRVEGGRLTGFNTDWKGFVDSLQAFLGPQATPPALVLGSGGSSRTVCYVLRHAGIEYTVVSRTPSEGELGYGDLSDKTIRRHPLIVNTTPLGMYPDTESAPDISYGAITEGHYLFDLVYNPPLTEFLRRGMERGAKVCNGHAMLVRQAELSWEIFGRR